MNRSPMGPPLNRKRKQPDTPEDIILSVIKSKKDMGIWKGDKEIKEIALSETSKNKAFRTLLGQNLIKEVVNIKNKGKKHYVASEFEPSKELTGGTWYVDGKLDNDFITALKGICSKIIMKMKVATVEGISEFIKRNSVINVKCTDQQIREILGSMVLDNEIIEVKSTGLSEFHSIPIGTICYKSAAGMGLEKGPKASAMVSIPCGVCPRINQCTPDGVISPVTCEYFKKYLANLEF